MKIPREILGTVGQCIYCRATQKPLQTEHIVPYGLNGPWELLEASCMECAKITSAFESDVLRNMLLAARTRLHFPTRHKHNRPERFSLTIKRRGREETIQVPLKVHFTAMMLPIFALPAGLDQRRYKKGIDLVGMVTIQVGSPPAQQVAKSLGTKTLAVSVTYQPVAFARLLAKIAYGFTVAVYGLNTIREAYVLPSIMGKSDDVGRWVGCSTNNSLAPSNDLHKIELSSINGEIHCNVRLFARFNAPEYSVIVGHVSEHSGTECGPPIHSKI